MRILLNCLFGRHSGHIFRKIERSTWNIIYVCKLHLSSGTHTRTAGGGEARRGVVKEGAGTRNGKPPPSAGMRGAETQQGGRGGTRNGKPPKRLFAKRSAPYRDEAPFCEAKWRGEPTRGAKISNVARSGVCRCGERDPLAGRLPHPRAWRGFAVAGASSVAPPAVPRPRLV